MPERKNRLRAGWATAWIMLLCGSSAFEVPRIAAQAPDESSTQTLSVTSRLVVLDVVVTDNKGNLVTGLDKSQFTVYEDKAEQRIRNFEGPKARAMPNAGQKPVHSTADLAKIGDAPVNVIVIDELNTPFSDTARAQQAIRHFLEKQPEVLPVPTLFLASGASRVTVLHDFTQSRADLLDSMKKHVTDVDFRALANQLNGGTMSAPDGFAKTLGALSEVASSLRGIPGHKNVIWVGTGFDKAYDLTSASDSDTQDIQDALQLVTRRMLDARMSVSTLDPMGVDASAPVEDYADEALSGSGPNATTDFAQDVSFDDLARSTGGTVVHGRNDLDRLIAADADRAADFYTLTYTPSRSSNAAQPYRNIRVVMKDPNLHAVTRTGYYAGPETEAPVTPSNAKTQSREFKFDLLTAGGSRLVYTGLHVTAAKERDGYRVFVEAGELQWTPQANGSRLAEVSIVGAAFNGKDKVLRQDAEEFKERIQDTDQPNGKQVNFRFAMPVPTGASRVRFVVRDAITGKIGSVDLHP
ncbi:MAG TPA: VWA domain-containing protein [Acidobacteriaceae bacterium]